MDPNPDVLVLEELRKRGDTAMIPRPVTIFIYGTEEDLKLVAERLSGDAWSWIDIEDQGDKFSLMAERELPATLEAIQAMADAVHAAIAGTNAIYDGWETSVERSH